MVVQAEVQEAVTSETSNSSNSTLKKGSKGEEVKKLQKRLNELGYGLTVDGDFGQKTENAVKDFQGNNGLSVDGVVGEKTWKKLNSKNAVGNGKGIFSADPNAVSGGSTSSGNSGNSGGGKGSSKENAIHNKSIFDLKWRYGNNNAYTYIGNTSKDLTTEAFKEYFKNSGYGRDTKLVNYGFALYCLAGSITEYNVEPGDGMYEIANAKKTRENGRDVLVIYPGSKGKGGHKVTDSNNKLEYYEIYTTVTGYYQSKDGKWYTDKCRIHFILADQKWWNNQNYTKMASCVPED